MKNKFLKYFAQLLILNTTDNIESVSLLLEKIINISKYYFIINPVNNYNEKWFKKILLHFNNEIKMVINVKLFNLWILKLHSLIPNSSYESNTDLSLAQIRKLSTASMFGLKFSQLWISQMTDRVQDHELQLYASSYFKHFYYLPRQQITFSTLKFLKYIPHSIKNKLKKYFLKLNDNKIIELFEIERNYSHSFIKRKILHDKNPYIQFSRNFLVNLIHKSQAIDYAILHLSQLGDYNIEYLLWKND